MSVLRESPWYQEIDQRARQETLLYSIEICLEARFGNDGLELMPQINQISDFEQLRAILRTIVVANAIEELQQVLN